MLSNKNTGMFSVNRSTMKLPGNSNVENPIYNLGGVPKCTITHLTIFTTNMGPNLLSAPRSCFQQVPQVVRHFHTSSISSPTNSETRNIVPLKKEEENMSPKLSCQDLPHQIMMTYAEVVKSVSRQLPKQLEEMIPPAATQNKTVKPPCSPMISKSCQILPKFQNFCNRKMANIQNSRCPWRVNSQNHSNTRNYCGPNKFCNTPERNLKSSENLETAVKKVGVRPFNISELVHPRPPRELNPRPQLVPPRPQLAPPRPQPTPPRPQLAPPRPLMSLKPCELAPPLLSHRENRSCPKVPENFTRTPRRKRRRQNKFWQTSPRVLSSNWRESTPVPDMSSTKDQVQEKVPVELESMDRDRKQSESSQASEDSWVVFERDSGCSYDSEVSSQPSDSDSDTETESSSDSEESDSPIPTDSGHNSESDEEIFLKVGDGDSVSLPPKVRLPPLRSSSRSSSSVNEESEDSDDDWIVFQSDSEDELDAPEKTDQAKGERRERRTSVKMVRFAPKEETCYLYDDDDYRAARCGEWEEKARDRTRFRARIMSTAEVIAPILNPEHRRKVMQSRFS